MFSKLLNGALKLYGLSPIVLVGFLALLSRPRNPAKKISVSNVPDNLLSAMRKALPTNHPYSYHLVNWLAVSKMETAGFSSPQYRMANNPWGMRPSTQRLNTQSGIFQTSGNGDFAKYNSVDDAAEDIFLYMKARKFPETHLSLFDFVSFMKSKGYFVDLTAGEYYERVVAWLER
jgi:hypothetical protein